MRVTASTLALFLARRSVWASAASEDSASIYQIIHDQLYDAFGDDNCLLSIADDFEKVSTTYIDCNGPSNTAHFRATSSKGEALVPQDLLVCGERDCIGVQFTPGNDDTDLEDAIRLIDDAKNRLSRSQQSQHDIIADLLQGAFSGNCSLIIGDDFEKGISMESLECTGPGGSASYTSLISGDDQAPEELFVCGEFDCLGLKFTQGNEEADLKDATNLIASYKARVANLSDDRQLLVSKFDMVHDMLVTAFDGNCDTARPRPTFTTLTDCARPGATASLVGDGKEEHVPKTIEVCRSDM
jgi:hypothetical protein